MRASHGTGIVECGSVIRNVMYLGWRLQKVGVSDLFGLVCSYSYVAHFFHWQNVQVDAPLSQCNGRTIEKSYWAIISVWT